MKRRFSSFVLATAAVAGVAFSATGVAQAGPVIDFGSGGFEIPLPGAGSGIPDVVGSVVAPLAPLLGSADTPGTVPGFPSIPLPAGPPADEKVVGGWYGTWTVDDTAYPALLNVSSANPVRANIDIPGRPCNADWTEIGRYGAVVEVAATVNSGNCSDNVWLMTLTENAIYATDSQGHSVSVEFRRG